MRVNRRPKRGVEMAEPTHEDALLMTQLMSVSAELGLAEANSFLWSDAFVADYAEFKKRFPAGSKEQAYVTTVAGWFETVGTLVKHGLFNEELVHDWLAIELVWKRLEGVLLGMREEAHEPRLYENFEALAARVPVRT
jgi:hypothetical protein